MMPLLSWMGGFITGIVSATLVLSITDVFVELSWQLARTRIAVAIIKVPFKKEVFIIIY
jgi:hypothetical protein